MRVCETRGTSARGDRQPRHAHCGASEIRSHAHACTDRTRARTHAHARPPARPHAHAVPGLLPAFPTVDTPLAAHPTDAGGASGALMQVVLLEPECMPPLGGKSCICIYTHISRERGGWGAEREPERGWWNGLGSLGCPLVDGSVYWSPADSDPDSPSDVSILPSSSYHSPGS